MGIVNISGLRKSFADLTAATPGAMEVNDFFNKSSKNADGTYPRKQFETTISAKVYNGSDVVGSATTKLRTANHDRKLASFSVSDIDWYSRRQTGRVFWNEEGKSATILANDGTIDKDTLREVIEGWNDTYNDDIYAGSIDNVTIEISEYKEAEDGIHNAKVSSAAVINQNNTTNANIAFAEVGDTFKVKFSYFDGVGLGNCKANGYAELVIDFTVGADQNAKINSTNTATNCVYR